MLGLGLGLGRVARGTGVAAPVNTVLPVISGTAHVGQTLSVTNGTWTGGVDSYAYQWRDDTAPISGATASTYLLTTGEIGGIITCTVTATNAGGSTAATSAGTAAVLDADPYFANVVLLCDFEGADGSTTFTDQSLAPHTLTANGNAQVDTAQFKFGAASYLSDGTGDYISSPDSADWRLSAANSDQFTIEFWIRPSSTTPSNRAIAGQDSGIGGQSWLFWLDTTGSGQLTLWRATNGSDFAALATSSGLTWAVQWYHVAVDKDSSGKVRIYRDGVMVASATPANSAFFDSGAALNIGAHASGTRAWNGHLDEPRITKGVARFASDSGFTVPTAAYPRQ